MSAKELLRALGRSVQDFLEGKESPDEIIYEPAQLAGVIIGCLVSLGLLFWLLWSWLVYKGGILIKAAALLKTVSAGKNLSDFGWSSWEEPGIFEGWLVNVAALLITCLLAWALWKVDKRPAPSRKKI